MGTPQRRPNESARPLSVRPSVATGQEKGTDVEDSQACERNGQRTVALRQNSKDGKHDPIRACTPKRNQRMPKLEYVLSVLRELSLFKPDAVPRAA